MKTTSKALFVCLGSLGLSHGIAITTESQVAAQLSWLLIFGLVAVSVLFLAESMSARLWGNNSTH